MAGDDEASAWAARLQGRADAALAHLDRAAVLPAQASAPKEKGEKGEKGERIEEPVEAREEKS